MIFDRMERLPLYRGLCPNLDQLIDRLTKDDAWKNLPMGRTEVDGDKAFINHNKVDLLSEQPRYERHRLYGDVQIALTGLEKIGCVPVEDLVWPDDPAETIFATGAEGPLLTMAPGTFAIFFPWDAHRPSLGEGTCEKLVGKFRWEEA